jgi:hypothetical protein
MSEIKVRIACPKCHKDDQLQRQCKVDVYEKGELYNDGNFDLDDSDAPEITWETQEYTNTYWCLNCEILLKMKLLDDDSFYTLVYKHRRDELNA